MNNAEKLFEELSGRKATSCIRIEEGLSNDTYIVNGMYVIRLRKPSMDKYYQVDLEREIALRMSDIGISEQIISFDRLNGSKVSAYISGTERISNPIAIEQLKLIATSINKLHCCGVSAKIDFDILNRFDYYKQESGESLNHRHEQKIIEKIQKDLKNEKKVLCHNDLVKGNILLKNNQAILIDWEFAGMNYPSFDIASFLSENNITNSDDIKNFLSFITGEKSVSKDYFEHIKNMMTFENYLWYYWAMMKYKFSRDRRYLDIASEKKNAI
ncbi:MAG: phosphotransferase [Bacilli bacterium]|jgi:thiamine kinase-like enzyme